MKERAGRLILLTALLGLLAFGACSDDTVTGSNNPDSVSGVTGEIPDYLEGIWSVHVQGRRNGSCFPMDPPWETTYIETLCMDRISYTIDSIPLVIGRWNPELQQVDYDSLTMYFDCSGTITSSALDVECHAVGSTRAGCTGSYMFHWKGSLDSLNWSVTRVIRVDLAEPNCDMDWVADCDSVYVTYERIGDAPPTCDEGGVSGDASQYSIFHNARQ